MRRVSGSRLGGPQVPPSPSLRIDTGFHARILARLLHSLFRVSRRVECCRRLAKRPERKEWTTSRPNGAPTPVTAGSDAERWSNGRERPCRRGGLRCWGGSATALLGGLRTLRAVGYKFASARRLRYLPDARSSPDARRAWPARDAESAGVPNAGTRGRPETVPTVRATSGSPLNSTRAGPAACVSLPTVSRPL